MEVYYVEQGTDVAGPVTVNIPRRATKHTIAAEGALGTVVITVRPINMSANQAITNDTIDLTAALPLFFEGSIDQITLTKTGGGVFSYSIVGQ